MAEKATYHFGTEVNATTASTDAFATRGPVTAQAPPSVGSPVIQTGAILAIWNEPGSNRLVRLKKIAMRELQSRTRTGATPVSYGIARISAHSGGEVVDPLKFDTTNADLPSQVLLLSNSIVTTTGSLFRSRPDIYSLNPTRVLGGLHTWPRMGQSQAGFNYGSLLHCCDLSAQTQSLVLREGEGLGVLTSVAARENMPIEVLVTVRVVATGATYLYRQFQMPGSQGAACAIWNGTGSGVVLEVMDVSLQELTVDVVTPRTITMEPISGLHQNSRGKAITLVPMDTTNPVPNAVVVVREAGVVQFNEDYAGSQETDEIGRRKDVGAVRTFLSVPYGASAGLANFCRIDICANDDQNAMVSRSLTQGNETVLRPGEGIALFQRLDFGGYGMSYWIDGRITIEDLAPAAGAAPGVVYVS